jgi:hypothetical protein
MSWFEFKVLVAQFSYLAVFVYGIKSIFVMLIVTVLLFHLYLLPTQTYVKDR